MNIIGIVAEYNPFHNGHVYHLKKIKEMFPNSLVILVLNGYFLQRGEISFISKEHKTEIALEEGIDIVIELPFVYGTQSADVFANISIKLLEKMHCEYIVFGSESNDLNKLNKIVDFMINNQDEYNNEVKKYLDGGLNYPTSLAKALNIDFDFKPNDLLGISYIKSIKTNKYTIKPLTIKRTNDYLDTTSNDDIISASNIRNKIINNEDIIKYIPNTTLPYIKNINFTKLFELLKYKIIIDQNLDKYLDVDEGIENRLKKVIINCNSIDDLIKNLKTKRYTHNKIQRMLIHILIGLTKEDNKKIELDYIKVLGFNIKGQDYLKKIKKDVNLPLINNKKSLVYHYELIASQIYDLITMDNSIKFETSNSPIIEL